MEHELKAKEAELAKALECIKDAKAEAEKGTTGNPGGQKDNGG